MENEAEKFVSEVFQGHILRVDKHINENEFRFIKTQGNSNETVAKILNKSFNEQYNGSARVSWYIC